MFTDQLKVTLLLLLCTGFLFYSLQLYLYTPVAKDGITAQTVEGKLLWQQKNCASCHQIYGLGGHLGPDLTNVFSKRTPEYITAFLKSGTVTMPDFHLSKTEIESLLAFLQDIDSSGNSDPRSFLMQLNGTIQQK